MSESDTTPTKQMPYQNKNTLEKLVKLDKKNSLINVYDRTLKYQTPASTFTHLLPDMANVQLVDDSRYATTVLIPRCHYQIIRMSRT